MSYADCRHVQIILIRLQTNQKAHQPQKELRGGSRCIITPPKEKLDLGVSQYVAEPIRICMSMSRGSITAVKKAARNHNPLSKLSWMFCLIISLKHIEYGFGYIMTRSPYTPCSIYLRGTIARSFSCRSALLPAT